MDRNKSVQNARSRTAKPKRESAAKLIIACAPKIFRAWISDA
jgi:hypothetical protein